MKLRLCLIAILLTSSHSFGGSPQQQIDQQERLRRRRTPIVDVFEQCRDSVVNISTTQVIESMSGGSMYDRMFNDMFDMPSPRSRQFKMTAVGSGFVIHPSGYIVTNAHVVAKTVEQKVIFSDGKQYDAKIVAQDESSDLAVLKIEVDHPLKPLPFGRSDDLMIGETTIAIGNPLGLENTLTTGVVSAVNRELTVKTQVMYKGLIQTDASINPGNSGGPLLNILGELIGINTAIRGDAQNIGFAIPVDRLNTQLPSMLDVERRYRIETGLEVSPTANPKILKVAAGSPGEQAGFRTGDQIVAIDNSSILKPVDYDIALIGKHAGDSIRVRVRRGQGDAIGDLKLVLAEKPKPDGALLAKQKLGMELEPLSSDLARRLGLRDAKGITKALLITEVMPGGIADKAGIESSDLLLQIDKHSVSTIDDLGLILETIPSGQSVPVTLIRVNRQVYLMRAELRIP